MHENQFNTLYLLPVCFLFLINFLFLSLILSKMFAPGPAGSHPESNIDPDGADAGKLMFHLARLIGLAQRGLPMAYMEHGER